jgi:hypothetical protein
MLAFLFPLLALAAAEIQEIDPASLHARTRQYRGPHLAAWDNEVKSNGLLLLSLGGTNSLPKDMLDFNEEALKLGYLALAVDYVNGPPDGSISTGCRPSTDPDCFDKFRREVVRGDPVSDLVKVKREDSIEFRITELVRHLAKQNPGRWAKFLQGDEVDWTKVVVAGHSQGSGHAAFLGKAHPLRGVVLLAGPQDSFEDGRTAGWLHQPSRTPSDRFYSFLHEKDFFDSQKQVAVARVLMSDPSAEIMPAEGCPPAQIHLTDRNDVGDPHMSVIEPFFRDVWRKILQQQVGD